MSAQAKNSLVFLPLPMYKASQKEHVNMQMKEETVKALSEAVKTDPIFSAVATVLAKRQRNRHNLTTRGLYYKMRKEGFQYQEKEYIPTMKLLGELGLAEVHLDSKGRVDSIRKFKVPLQAIGAVAKGEKPTLVKVAKIEAAPVAKKEAKARLVKDPSTTITVSFNGKPIQVTMPSSITKEEFIVILTKFEVLGIPAK